MNTDRHICLLAIKKFTIVKFPCADKYDPRVRREKYPGVFIMRLIMTYFYGMF